MFKTFGESHVAISRGDFKSGFQRITIRFTFPFREVTSSSEGKPDQSKKQVGKCYTTVISIMSQRGFHDSILHPEHKAHLLGGTRGTVRELGVKNKDGNQKLSLSENVDSWALLDR